MGGNFQDNTMPPSILETISSKITDSNESQFSICCAKKPLFKFPAVKRGGFLCIGLSIESKKGKDNNSNELLVIKKVVLDESNETNDGGGAVEEVVEKKRTVAVEEVGWRTFVSPLERLKMEYMLHGEEKKLFKLIKAIAATRGLRGFWKGNLVNILRTAPFKAVNFCASDTYRKQLLKLCGNEETTYSERFIAGDAAGITATVLCLPLDTVLSHVTGMFVCIRSNMHQFRQFYFAALPPNKTKMVAPDGEASGGVIGSFHDFHHVIQTEGFFALYKGLLPSILCIAPSAAVFYGVYDIMKSSYLHSPEGRKRTQNMNRQQGQELNASDQEELVAWGYFWSLCRSCHLSF
ncbi:hypothetical protein ACH5RR_034580 [Cinchona calisaya]|uniref:Uncharacterized protein n=1 Tax=Cinchona calisaya TaxID=153742 RepID=A0ABD2YEU3_9GENT